MALLGRDTLITGPIAAGPLLLETFRGTETLGIPYRYELSLLSDDPNIPVGEVLGQPLSVRITIPAAIAISRASSPTSPRPDRQCTTRAIRSS